jgi:hypothetical protein
MILKKGKGVDFNLDTYGKDQATTGRRSGTFKCSEWVTRWVQSAAGWLQLLSMGFMKICKESAERLFKGQKNFEGLVNFTNVVEPYYKGGWYNYLLDLKSNWFTFKDVCFQNGCNQDHKIFFFQLGHLVLMRFINRMRHEGVRKLNPWN